MTSCAVFSADNGKRVDIWGLVCFSQSYVCRNLALVEKKKQSFCSPINKHFMTWLDIIIKVDEKSFAKSVVKWFTLLLWGWILGQSKIHRE